MWSFVVDLDSLSPLCTSFSLISIYPCKSSSSYNSAFNEAKMEVGNSLLATYLNAYASIISIFNLFWFSKNRFNMFKSVESPNTGWRSFRSCWFIDYSCFKRIKFFSIVISFYFTCSLSSKFSRLIFLMRLSSSLSSDDN